jgi:hypothetical protein
MKALLICLSLLSFSVGASQIEQIVEPNHKIEIEIIKPTLIIELPETPQIQIETKVQEKTTVKESQISTVPLPETVGLFLFGLLPFLYFSKQPKAKTI